MKIDVPGAVLGDRQTDDSETTCSEHSCSDVDDPSSADTLLPPNVAFSSPTDNNGQSKATAIRVLYRSALHKSLEAYQCCLSWFAGNYVVLILLGALGTSLNGVCIKVLTKHVSVFQVVIVRAVSSLVIIAVMSWWDGFPLLGPKSKTHLCFLRGVFGTIAFLLLAVATFLLPLSESAFMTNSYPVWTAVFSSVLGMEQLGMWSWLGLSGSIIGNALVAQPPFLFGTQGIWSMRRILGIVVAALHNVFNALTFITIRYIGLEVNTMTLTFYMQTLSMLSCLPFLTVGYPKPPNARHSVSELAWYAEMILGGAPLQVLITRAFQIGPPTKVTSLFMTNMLFSAVFGIAFFSEDISGISVIGAMFILVSVFLVLMHQGKNPEVYQPNRNMEALGFQTLSPGR